MRSKRTTGQVRVEHGRISDFRRRPDCWLAQAYGLAHTETKAIADLKEAGNADYVARSFHQAAAIILEEATAGY